MKLRFKYQKFQADAAKAVVDVFAGQPSLTHSYGMDTGTDYITERGEESQVSLHAVGWRNAEIIPRLTDDKILDNIRKIQRNYLIKPSEKLEGKYNLTIEMETGVGKTYTYIKTMYELYKHYGWTKYIIVTPSIAVREGVYKTFQVTREHFSEEYGKKIHAFIYRSDQLTEIDRFASDNSINAMIINAQAFNARGKDARRIYMKLDSFRSRRPIDVIARTNPILIIDEPQSVEGKQTKERLKEFCPLLTLRYSATHREDSIYNMIYRLDAMDAYNKRLVKRIAVKGITESGATATDSFLYLESVNLSKSDPTATICFDYRGASGLRKVSRTVKIGYNLYDNSAPAGQSGLDEYKDGFVVKFIDGRDNSIEFLNGVKIYAGEVIGQVNEEQIRRIQIRETILSHIAKERQLFRRGIKCLSLFFIDEVSHYKCYNEAGQARNGIFADIFEEEYSNIISTMQTETGDDAYLSYLNAIPVERTHAGYFSIDKKGRMTNSRFSDKKERTSDDINAYDLIMKNKELLLEQNPKKSPVRFIFSHSALREGWDNPNVFQICTLKSSGSDIRKRQEVGRGLRLCVNRDGVRMDESVLGKDVQNINVLTVIASESYDSFARGLQTEIAEAVADRPRKVTADLFINRVVRDSGGREITIENDMASAILYDLTINQYIDRKGMLTDKFYEDKSDGGLRFADDVADFEPYIIEILDSVYDAKKNRPEDDRKNNVVLHIQQEKLDSKEFQELWSRINAKSVYIVNFDSEELIAKAIESLNAKLRVPSIYFEIESGKMKEIGSKEELQSGTVFERDSKKMYDSVKIQANQKVKYDLVGKLVEETGLTRKAIIQILTGIEKIVFQQFRDNPEEFIIRAAALINDEKATAIIQHITYDTINAQYSADIFTEAEMKGKLGINAMETHRHLYDYLIYDSKKEYEFASNIDALEEVAVYVKLPSGFYINTPVGRYNPDWAIAFRTGVAKHIYFVAETKGSMNTLHLNHITPIEQAKIDCAIEHFKAISGDSVTYKVISDYSELLQLVRE